MTYNNGGEPFYNLELTSVTGAALPALAVGSLAVAYAPTAGGVEDTPAIVGQCVHLCGVNVECRLTDPTPVVTMLRVIVVGTWQGITVEWDEVWTNALGLGSNTYKSTAIFDTITSIKTYCVGGDGSTMISFNYGNRLGLPYQIAATSDIRTRRVDSTEDTTGGAISTDGYWDTDVTGSAPNGAHVYFVTGRSTA